ncbi:MAG: hypothetical protein IPL61_33745 [Myxococcales bacterium]|nr:hypothetical protein [Myxococcales bacterium]
MIALPAALAAWADELAALPTELALALAPWVGRLALAVGPMAERRAVDVGEPDGFTGLARRGSYERLIASEWALAEAAPDEFLRRAASGEHLFHELARRGSRGAQRTVAIVSAGPAQLGAPRLAHVAALVVLARRAAAAGASFAWGVLEDPDRVLVEGVDAIAVRRLLDARTVRPGGDAALAGWREALAAAGELEPWWIGDGGELAEARGRGARCLVVRDVLAPGERALEVEVHHRGPPRRVRFELPAAAVCAQIMRDAGRAGVGRVAYLGGRARGIQFAAGGRRLLVELDGRVECWPVPNSPRDQIGRPRPWDVPADRRVIALGVEDRTVLAVVGRRGGSVTIEVRSPRAPTVITATVPLQVAARLTPPLVGACGLVTLSGAPPALVLEYDGALLAIDGVHAPSRRGAIPSRFVYTGAGRVVATAIFARQVLWAAREDDRVDVWRWDGDGQRVVARADADALVWFGHDPAPVGVWGPVVTSAGRSCTIHADGRGARTFAIDGEIVGGGADAALVRVDDHHLEWQGPEGRRPVPRSSGPIAEVVVATSVPYLAWLTPSGEVIVRSTRHDAVLMHLVPGPRRPA